MFEFQIAAADWILGSAAASADLGRAVVANADEAAVPGGEVITNFAYTVLTREKAGTGQAQGP